MKKVSAAHPLKTKLVLFPKKDLMSIIKIFFFFFIKMRLNS